MKENVILDESSANIYGIGWNENDAICHLVPVAQCEPLERRIAEEKLTNNYI